MKLFTIVFISLIVIVFTLLISNLLFSDEPISSAIVCIESDKDMIPRTDSSAMDPIFVALHQHEKKAG